MSALRSQFHWPLNKMKHGGLASLLSFSYRRKVDDEAINKQGVSVSIKVLKASLDAFSLRGSRKLSTTYIIGRLKAIHSSTHPDSLTWSDAAPQAALANSV